MAANTVLNVGLGGDVIRDVDRAGVKTQIVGLDLNPGGAEVLMAGAMPVTGTFWQATQPVSLAAPVAVTGTFWQATQPVSGTVTANVGTGTQPVSGTFWQATQPVSGTVTANAGTGTMAVSGTFWQATQPVSGTVTANAGTGTQAVSLASLPALAAGTALIGQTAASNETGTVYSGTTALVPKFAVISASASGNTQVVAAVAGKKIRVLRWAVSSNGAVNVKFQRGTTDVTGLYYLTQFASVGGGYCPVGHFETAATEALNINLSAGIAVGGVCTYIEV